MYRIHPAYLSWVLDGLLEGVTVNPHQLWTTRRQNSPASRWTGCWPSSSVFHLTPEIESLIDRALSEDLSIGDPTCEALIPPDLQSRAVMVAKTGGVLAGVDVALAVFRRVDPTLDARARLPDGSALGTGDVIAESARIRGVDHDGRADRAQLRAAHERDSHRNAPVRGRGGRPRRAHRGHAQDHPRAAHSWTSTRCGAGADTITGATWATAS